MWVLTHVTVMENRLFHSVTHVVPRENLSDCAVLLGLRLVQGWGGGRSGRVVLIDNGRVYQCKAADALVQVKTTTFGTNVGLNMLLNISSRYFGGLFWSRQLRGLPSSDGYFSQSIIMFWLLLLLAMTMVMSMMMVMVRVWDIPCLFSRMVITVSCHRCLTRVPLPQLC